GRLIIYNLKTLKRKNRSKSALSPRQDTTSSSTFLGQITGKGGYELEYVWESEREDPVVALASMGDSYLVVGAEKTINLGAKCSLIQQGCLVKSVCRPKHVLPWTDNIQLDEQDDHAQTNEMGPDYGAVATTDSGTMWTIVRISSQAYILLKELERAMCAFSSRHPARPLLSSGRSVDRALDKAYSSCSNAIDGTVSTAFVDYLTLDEQLQVVASSDELQRLALALDIDI
ncbi:hypothetical protein LPJ72_006370, partial [Coemansia sp. Benny D160-2]